MKEGKRKGRKNNKFLILLFSFCQTKHVKQPKSQVIYNFHYSNGAPAMFASQYYLKLKGKKCQKLHCHNGVVDHLGHRMLFSSKTIKYFVIWDCKVQKYPVKKKHYWQMTHSYFLEQFSTLFVIASTWIRSTLLCKRGDHSIFMNSGHFTYP